MFQIKLTDFRMNIICMRLLTQTDMCYQPFSATKCCGLGRLGHNGVSDLELVWDFDNALEYCWELTSMYWFPKHFNCCDCLVVILYDLECKTDLIFKWIYFIIYPNIQKL